MATKLAFEEGTRITFNDVLIRPKFSSINSRKDVDLTNKFGFKLPVLSSNMDTVTGTQMCIAMIKAGGMGVLHRFWSLEENFWAAQRVYSETQVSPWISVGVGEEEFKRVTNIGSAWGSTIVIDVAHGAQQQVADQYKRIKDWQPTCEVVVGNFADVNSVCDFILGTRDQRGRTLSNGCGFKHIKDFPDMIKVGIGPGSVCSTRLKTGVGIPQLSAIIECSSLGIPVIADGGMSTPGDVAKALGAGAQFVMLGRMLSGTEECPGELITRQNGDTWESVKEYRGSASKESYSIQNKDDSWRTAEGESTCVSYKGPVSKVLQDIEGGLRSSFTYVGARTLSEFQERVEFIKVSQNSVIENGVRYEE